MKNKYDFSNRTSYDGLPCKENEVLVPVVMDRGFKEMVKASGIREEYIETWKIGKYNKKVPVAFVPWPSDQFDDGMKVFNYKVSEYLKKNCHDSKVVSLDKAKEDMLNDERKGYEITFTLELDEKLKCDILLEKLIMEMKAKGPDKLLYLKLRIQGLTKKEIFEKMDSKLKKTQLYEFAKKTDKEIIKLIEEGL